LATIRDVAEASGVSIATVSRVMNGSDRVNEETRRRVWSAAGALDYWPNGAARTLTTRRTHAIGVLLPDLYGEFFSEVIRGIDRTARLNKHQTIISSSHADTEGVMAAAKSMQGRVDGLIVMAPDRGSVKAIEQIKKRFPVVLLNPRFRVSGCHAISVANLDGAFAVASHVLEQGHRHVAILKGPAGNVDAEERLRGYRKAVEAAGTRVTISEIDGDFTESSGYAAANLILRRSPAVTAVLAANDYMAIGLLSALEAAGVRVPGEISVTGFDDIAIARYLKPPLTTVHVDACDLGERAVRGLMESLVAGGEVHPQRQVVPSRLVIRTSCGPPPGLGAKRRAAATGGSR